MGKNGTGWDFFEGFPFPFRVVRQRNTSGFGGGLGCHRKPLIYRILCRQRRPVPAALKPGELGSQSGLRRSQNRSRGPTLAHSGLATLRRRAFRLGVFVSRIASLPIIPVVGANSAVYLQPIAGFEKVAAAPSPGGRYRQPCFSPVVVRCHFLAKRLTDGSPHAGTLASSTYTICADCRISLTRSLEIGSPLLI